MNSSLGISSVPNAEGIWFSMAIFFEGVGKSGRFPVARTARIRWWVVVDPLTERNKWAVS